MAYVITELAHDYGFIDVFIAALQLHFYEWDREYKLDLHDFEIVTERLLIAAVLVLFGGAIVGGLFTPLT